VSFDEQPDGDPHGECAAEIARLAAELAKWKEHAAVMRGAGLIQVDHAAQLEALIKQAMPWVQTRMERHYRKSKTEKQPYYQARHAREQEYCEGWLATAAALTPSAKGTAK
jgi:hypothetical protein